MSKSSNVTEEENKKKFSHHVDVEITTNFVEYSKENEEGSLVKYNYAVSLYREEIYYRMLTKIDLSCKYFVYFDNMVSYRLFYYKTDKEELDDYILLLDNADLLKEIQLSFYKKESRLKYVARNDTGYRAIIFNNSSNPLSMVIQDISRPILLTDSSTFSKLKKLAKDINYSKEVEAERAKTSQIQIGYDNGSSLLPISYMKISSRGLMYLAIGVFIWWHFISIKHRKHFTAIQKVLTGLLYLKFGVIIFIYLYVDMVSIYNPNHGENTFTRVYLETGIGILSSIYRTIFYFLILLISYGWRLFITGLGHNEVKKFICYYLLIYASVCVDQIIDLSLEKWNYFLPSELKNMVFNLLITGIIIKKCTLSLSYLKRKLVYAYEHSPQFVNAIRRKIKMMVNLMLSVAFNSIMIIFVHSFFRIYYNKFEVFEHIINYTNTNNLDIIFFCLLLWTFRTRPQHESFYIQLATSDNLHYKGSIQVYRVNIYENHNPKEEKKFIKENKNVPLIVVNPFYHATEHIENICIGIPSSNN